MIDQRIGSLPYELNWIACIPLLLPLFGKKVGLDRMFLKRLGNLSSIRVADFVVALALKTIGSTDQGLGLVVKDGPKNIANSFSTINRISCLRFSARASCNSMPVWIASSRAAGFIALILRLTLSAFLRSDLFIY